MHFLVKWKGYPTSDNSWEPRENLHADRLITEYNKKKQGQAEPKKKGVKSRRARTEEIIPFSPKNQHSPLHSNIMSARSAPIVSLGAMDATHSPIVSSSTTSPVTHTSMLSSPPREAASPSSISPIAREGLTTAMKEEDVPGGSRILPLTTPTAASYSGPSVPKAYVSDDPEHVDDCRNCGLPHDTRPALDSQHWPLVLVELLEQEKEREARWDREGVVAQALMDDFKARVGPGESRQGRDDEDTIGRVHTKSPQMEIHITIELKNIPEENGRTKGGEEKPKKKASRDEMRRCFYCDGIGHLQRHCSKCIEDKRQGKIRPYKKSNKKVTRTRVEVVSNPGDYDYEGEADSDWYQGRD